MKDAEDLLNAEKKDLKELGILVLLLALASGLGTASSYPPSIIIVLFNWVGVFLFVPAFIGTIRILKRGTPAIIVIGLAVLLLTCVLAMRTVKWVLNL